MGKSKLDSVVGVAILLVCGMVGFTVISNQLNRPKPPQVQKPGDKLNTPDYDFSKHPKTLIAVVSDRCQHCKNQIPFYRSVIAQGANLVLALTTDLEKGKSYAAENGLAIDVIPDAQKVLKIRGTPTLLLVDRTGEVEKVWEGEIPRDKQLEVIAMAKGQGI